MIASTVHSVVFIKKTPQGWRIEKELNVTGFENGQYIPAIMVFIHWSFL